MIKRTSDKYYALQCFAQPVFICVDGHPVRFTGYREFEFFYYCDRFGDYFIVEATTGMSIGSSSWPLSLKRKEAKARLDRAGKEELKRIIRESIEKYGLSPRYKEVEE